MYVVWTLDASRVVGWVGDFENECAALDAYEAAREAKKPGECLLLSDAFEFELLVEHSQFRLGDSVPERYRDNGGRSEAA